MAVEGDVFGFPDGDSGVSVIGRLAALLGSEENALRIIVSLLFGSALALFFIYLLSKCIRMQARLT
jgi:hypothetical protein